MGHKCGLLSTVCNYVEGEAYPTDHTTPDPIELNELLGKMVDVNVQGKGIGTKMCLCAMEISKALGLRMFETISKDNIASLRSTEKVLNVRIVEEMENGYLYIEDLGIKSE